MDNKVKFVCCDMPDATELTIHIFAAIAQWERKRISERIKEALTAKKHREPAWKPGTNNLTKEGVLKSAATNRKSALKNKNVRHAYHFIKPLREEGLSYRKIAEMLNTEGYPTRKGKKFYAQQVKDIWKRFEGE
jgi:DNA invertase Pin-like site-specific DNA recombinase